MNLLRSLPCRAHVVALSSLMLLFSLGCSDKRSPEQQIEALLEQGVKALEDKDIKAAGELLADSYRDSNGRDQRQMKGIAFLVLRRGPVHLSLSDKKIELDASGTNATVSMKVTALQTAGAPQTVGDLMPRGRAIDVQVHVVKEGDDWRVTAIEGDGMGSSDFE